MAGLCSMASSHRRHSPRLSHSTRGPEPPDPPRQSPKEPSPPNPLSLSPLHVGGAPHSRLIPPHVQDRQGVTPTRSSVRGGVTPCRSPATPISGRRRSTRHPRAPLPDQPINLFPQAIRPVHPRATFRRLPLRHPGVRVLFTACPSLAGTPRGAAPSASAGDHCEQLAGSCHQTVRTAQTSLPR
jgi:hypothetical protein